ncbi:MAG: 3-methyl-2-oxobutanoate hydroxymethyltransferase [Actinomycetota bacterium]
MPNTRPTLLNGCARAATTAEARFRVDYPNSTRRASRIISLDEEAASILGSVAEESWQGARFLAYEAPSLSDDGDHRDAVLRSLDGSETRLSDELDGADVAVMVATGDHGAEGASIIGRACFSRRIMTAGLVVRDGGSPDDAVNALRPFASVLVVSPDERFIRDVLRALRA